MKSWCKADWPITISGGDRLAIKFSSKDHRRWNWKLDIKSEVAHINAVWEDIEVRNFLIEFVYTHLIEDIEAENGLKKQNLYIQTLYMLSVDMYVDLDIIGKILRKGLAQHMKGISYKKFLSRISKIRNWIKIHRDKADSYKVLGQSWSTYNSGTDIRLDVSKKNGKELEQIILTPQMDAQKMADLLTKILK